MLVGDSLAGSICGVSTASETPLIVTIVPTKMRGGPVITTPIDRRQRLGEADHRPRERLILDDRRRQRAPIDGTARPATRRNVADWNPGACDPFNCHASVR